MTPDDLVQLMRLSGTFKVREEIRRAHKEDHVFFEKLVNLFSRCKREGLEEAWPPAER